MKNFIIYYNAMCSKSRETLKILKDNGVEPYIFEYLKTPLHYDQLRLLCSSLEFKDFVRSDEPIFRKLNLSIDDKEGVMKAMVKAPNLMQRPIVCYREKSVICRPPDKVLELLA